MPYTLIKKFNNQHSHITFQGHFHGQDVTWDTHFFSIKGYNAEKNIQATNMKQFIDIKSIYPDTMKLTVALNISEVNHPNIQKMMIMIKQYKNLSLVRHEYG